jgi:hypothetical protein
MASAGTLANAQCTISWTSNAVAIVGNTLSLTLNFAPTLVFAGSKVIYSAARDVNQNSSGWQPIGVWPATAGAPAITTSVYPPNSAGLGPAGIMFTFSDGKGVADLGVLNMLINGAVDARQACYLAFVQPTNMLYLVNDRGDALLPGQSLSVPGTLGNNQCTVSWSATAVNRGFDTMTVTLVFTFSPLFSGNRLFYLAGRDINGLNNTGWQAMGIRAIQ